MPTGTSPAPVSNTSVAVASSSPYTDLSSGSSSESAVRGRMVFRNVTFAYPLRGGLPVLKNLNVVIPAGKKTAIVGGSGAGKSTLMRLMCRFYDPDQGAVLIDGRDVRTLTQKVREGGPGLRQAAAAEGGREEEGIVAARRLLTRSWPCRRVPHSCLRLPTDRRS